MDYERSPALPPHPLGAAAESSMRDALYRAAPAAVAIVPVSMLFGVLAGRADWSLLHIVLVRLLGFPGSGQLAVLPLAESGAGFLTMVLLTASINCRYLPIAYTTARRLPKAGLPRACMAHMLGDEAYATEQERDSTRTVFLIRAALFGTWVLAGVAGGGVARLLPAEWLGANVNLGYPASVVLMYLSIAQLRVRLAVPEQRRMACLMAAALCAGIALFSIHLLGPVYFWIPSVLLATVLLTRAGL